MAFDVSGDERFDLVGESHYQGAIRSAAGEEIGAALNREHVATLLAEPSNPFDKNAVMVLIEGQCVGYVPANLAEIFAPHVVHLTAAHGAVTAIAQIRGSGESPGFGVSLHLDPTHLGLLVVHEVEGMGDGLIYRGDASSAGAASSYIKAPERTTEAAASDLEVDAQTLEARRGTVQRAVDKWKSDLIDLTGRNRLLYFRELETGTLSLDGADKALIGQILARKRVFLRKLFPERPEEIADGRRKLTRFEDSVRRTRAITRTARAYEEERGVRTLYLSCGLATWMSAKGSRPPAAPLLLVPVEVRASGANQADFNIKAAGELEINPVLIHFLRSEFSVDLTPEALFASTEIDGEIDTIEELELAFEWISQRCAQVPDWTIADRFVLGNFWYAKLPMVKDLESSIDTIASHDVAAAMAGHPEAKERVARQRRLGPAELSAVDHVHPSVEFNVVDSDSSQSAAIKQVLEGRNLVLKGPPGTGKSQTIANLIAGAVGNGKSVLFVAEKRAAIEAVTKRLNTAGLDGIVLDLHQGSETRRWLSQQLAESLEAIKTAGPAKYDKLHRQLERTRESLSDHAQRLHRVNEDWETSLFDASCALIADGSPKVKSRLRGSKLKAVTTERLDQLVERVEDLVFLDGFLLRNGSSPWRSATITTQAEVAEASELIESLEHLISNALTGSLAADANSSGLPVPQTFEEARILSDLWRSASDLSSTFEPEIFNSDLVSLVETLAPWQAGGASRAVKKLFSSPYRQANKDVSAVLKQDEMADLGGLYTRLIAARDLQTNWSATAISDTKPTFPSDLAALLEALHRAWESTARLQQLLGSDLQSLSFDGLEKGLQELQHNMRTAHRLPDIQRAFRELAEAGLGDFVAEIEASDELIEDSPGELRKLWHRSVADHLSFETSGISGSAAAFSGERQSQLRERFQTLEHEHLASSAQRVRRIAAESAVRAQDENREQQNLVHAQARRKRGHLPIRELFQKAPDVLTKLRPCWVMSPLMVSQLIPSDCKYFDIVIFDEASQVRPVDAISSLIRGRQLVVAGDERQLPPTNFFESGSTEGSDSDEFDEDDASDIGDYESVLDVLMPMFDTEMLSWHYRSRDERLIGFSNQEIYGGSLTTFPGAVTGEVIKHVLVDKLPEENEPRVSPTAEVDEVVRLILEHTRLHPEESLGVIAFGIKHATAIETALLAALTEYPELGWFFGDDQPERFFVKNLERVQGDERDAIIIAIGYGKSADGTLRHNFGPLNRVGGERRLNVAVSRAKRRMTVVSTFAAEDIDTTRSSAEGVALLQSFIDYAAQGGLSSESSSETDLTTLHEQIHEELEKSGFIVEAGVGNSNDRLDLVIVDPKTMRPAVAIEFDGPAYAKRPSVRDRERLRSEQLERLDWKVIRVWTQEWFDAPQSASEALVTQVKSCLAELEDERNSAPAAPSQVEPTGEQESEPRSVLRKQPTLRSEKPVFNSGGPSINDWSPGDLVRLAEWIESDEVLRTAEELQREMMQELGISRRGQRVAAALDQAIATLRQIEDEY